MEPNSNKSEQANCAECNDNGTSSGRTTSSPGCVPHNDRNDEQSNDIKNLKKRVNWELVFSGVVASTAIATALVAYFQWQAMNRQLDEMRGNGEQTDKLIALIAEQSKAAVEQAKAANDSLAVSRRNFQADQRPYVIPHITPGAPKAGAPLEARVMLINYGKTPALHVNSHVAVLVGPDALKQTDRWFDDDRQKVFDASIGNIIPPGLTVGLSREIPAASKKMLTPEDIQTLVANNDQAVFVVRNRYFDSAGNSFGTDSCYRLIKGWQTAFCNGHNEIHQHYKEGGDSKE